MSDFNYQKAYYVYAVPAYNSLNGLQRNAIKSLWPIIGELQQNRELKIPLSPVIEGILFELSTKEIAELARALYFVGHWKPSHAVSLFDNRKGESWKISNCCDQILYKRLNPPSNIQIHEGVLRVTYLNRNCWFWDDFGLATPENLEIFKACGLPFSESSIEASSKILRKQIGDLWDTENVNSVYDNYEYEAWQIRVKIEEARKELLNKREELGRLKANEITLRDEITRLENEIFLLM